MAEKGFSQSKLADMLGMSRNTFAAKLRKGVFDSDEMSQMIDVLEIENPLAIFLRVVVLNTYQTRNRLSDGT